MPDMCMSRNEVLRLAVQVFEQFCSLYRQQLIIAGRGNSEFVPECWWGRPDGNSVWAQSARFFLGQTEAWPEYLLWLFKSGADGGKVRLPEPSVLHSPPASRKFAQHYSTPSYQHDVRHRLALELGVQQAQLLMATQTALDASGLGPKKMDRTRAGMRCQALCTADISPLLVCCVALQESLTQIAGMFRTRAWDQYWPYARLYDEVWGALIPDDLRREYNVVLNQRKGKAQ